LYERATTSLLVASGAPADIFPRETSGVVFSEEELKLPSTAQLFAATDFLMLEKREEIAELLFSPVVFIDFCILSRLVVTENRSKFCMSDESVTLANKVEDAVTDVINTTDTKTNPLKKPIMFKITPCKSNINPVLNSSCLNVEIES